MTAAGFEEDCCCVIVGAPIRCIIAGRDSIMIDIDIDVDISSGIDTDMGIGIEAGMSALLSGRQQDASNRQNNRTKEEEEEEEARRDVDVNVNANNGDERNMTMRRNPDDGASSLSSDCRFSSVSVGSGCCCDVLLRCSPYPSLFEKNNELIIIFVIVHRTGYYSYKSYCVLVPVIPG